MTIIGPKQELRAATSPHRESPRVCALLSQLFDIPTTPVANFLSLILTPSNQIIHPARYSAIFADYDGTKTYTREELGKAGSLTLYDELDALGAETMSRLDAELQVRQETKRELTGMTSQQETVALAHAHNSHLHSHHTLSPLSPPSLHLTPSL